MHCIYSVKITELFNSFSSCVLCTWHAVFCLSGTLPQFLYVNKNYQSHGNLWCWCIGVKCKEFVTAKMKEKTTCWVGAEWQRMRLLLNSDKTKNPTNMIVYFLSQLFKLLSCSNCMTSPCFLGASYAESYASYGGNLKAVFFGPQQTVTCLSLGSVKGQWRSLLHDLWIQRNSNKMLWCWNHSQQQTLCRQSIHVLIIGVICDLHNITFLHVVHV